MMNETSKIIGKELRRIFAAIRRPMGWGVIDAFTSLEEREEERGRNQSSGATKKSDRDKKI